MSEFFDVIKKRLGNVGVEDKYNYINELREISQEIILSGLAQAGFFDNAVFMGGTALR
jgi:predicted nucleotidyltransferase component of viral defense system